jgi:hypothetical protein
MAIAGRIVGLSLMQGQWPETTGTVVAAHQATVSHPTKGPRVRHVFHYTYTVAGDSYEGSRYSFATVGGAQGKALRHWQVNDTVPVYYHPERPWVAVVSREPASIFVWLFGSLGLPWVVASLAGLVAPRSTDDR